MFSFRTGYISKLRKEKAQTQIHWRMHTTPLSSLLADIFFLRLLNIGHLRFQVSIPLNYTLVGDCLRGNRSLRNKHKLNFAKDLILFSFKFGGGSR